MPPWDVMPGYRGHGRAAVPTEAHVQDGHALRPDRCAGTDLDEEKGPGFTSKTCLGGGPWKFVRESRTLDSRKTPAGAKENEAPRNSKTGPEGGQKRETEPAL